MQYFTKDAPRERADLVRGLQPLTAALLECVTPAEVASVVVGRGISVLGADAGLVARMSASGEELEIVELQGYAESVASLWRRFPVSGNLPLSIAVRAKQPSFISTCEEWEALFPQLISLRTRDTKASVDLPLLDGGDVLGGLHFSFAEERPFSAEDRAFLMELAHQCALALSRATLRDEAAKAQRRMEFLVRASEVLSASLDYERTLDNLARLCVPDLADYTQIYVVAPEGSAMHRLSVAHRSPAAEDVIREIQARYPADRNPRHPAMLAISTGATQLTQNITDEMIAQNVPDPEYLRLILPFGIRSVLAVPLTARGRTLGAMMLLMTKDSGREFDHAAVVFFEELARRAGIFVDNARLYAEAQREISERAIRDQRLTLAIEGADLGTWHHNLVTGELTWSQRCKELFGLPSDYVVSIERIRLLLHPDDFESTMATRERAIKDHTNYDVQYRAVWPDGSPHWIRSRGKAFYDSAGTPVRFEGVMMDIDERVQAEHRRLGFFRDVLNNATDGKLRLQERADQLPPSGECFGAPIDLSADALGALRARIRQAAVSLPLTGDRLSDLITAADEAAMNAVVHAGGGTATVCIRQDSQSGLLVRIEDNGSGIAIEQLPNATLLKGYTTAGTMGFGFKLIIQAVDRVWLTTGERGTVVVLEQDRTPPPPEWLPRLMGKA